MAYLENYILEFFCKKLSISCTWPNKRCCAMSILKYFERDSAMPNPTGPLSKVVPSEGIKAANEEVSKVMNSVKLSVEERYVPSGSRSRGPYERFTPEEKARIGRMKCLS